MFLNTQLQEKSSHQSPSGGIVSPLPQNWVKPKTSIQFWPCEPDSGTEGSMKVNSSALSFTQAQVTDSRKAIKRAELLEKRWYNYFCVPANLTRCSKIM